MYTLDASVWVNGFDRKEPGAQATPLFLSLLNWWKRRHSWRPGTRCAVQTPSMQR